MNKVFNINLGGFAFTIDEDAYHHLKQYLSAIDRHFKDSEGFDDITTDIEIRMGEIFREKMQNRQIVSLKDVTEAINIMGTPEDFGAESNYTGVPEEETRTKTKSEKKTASQKFGKRLYRNPDETVVGGVASGVSAYFGIDDPVWVRIAFVVLLFGGGFAIPLYIILWAALPEAKTAKQKLEMRGEKIDVNSIAKTIEEEITHLGNKFQEIGDEFKEGGKFNKKKSKNRHDNEGEAHYGKSSMDGGVAFVRQSAGAFEQFVRVTFRPILYVIGVILMLFVAALWIALIVLTVTGSGYAAFMVGNSNAQLVNTLAFFAIGLPIFSTALSILRTFFRMKVSKYLRIGITILFIGVISGIFYFGSRTAKEFNVQKSFEATSQLSDFDGNMLSISSQQTDLRDNFIHFGGSKIIDGALVYNGTELEIMASEGADFELTETYFGRGATTTQATQNAKNTLYEWSSEGEKLVLPTFVKLKKNLFRDQYVKLTLRIPQGKSVQLNEDICWNMPLKVETKDGFYYGHQLVNKTLTVTEEGLICENCEEKPMKENVGFDFKDFNELSIYGNVKIYLSKGDYSVTAGDVHLHHSLNITQDKELLRIEREEDGTPLKVYISVPDLTILKIDNVEDTWITNLEVDNLKMEISGNSDIHANGLTTQRLEVIAFDNSEITLKGSSQYLKTILQDDAELDADRFQVNVANMEGYGSSDAKIHVTDTLYQKIIDNADLDVDGNPVKMNE